jgi:2-acetylphloroglucinol acetyltransferase
MSQNPEQIYRLTTPSILRQWREHGGKYRLEGTKCTECGSTWFPRRAVCGKCHSLKVETYACPHTGTIVANEVNNFFVLTFLGYGENMPKYSAMVKLDDGLHVLGEVVDVKNPEDIQPGKRVKMILRKQRREGNTNWAYVFKFTLTG